MKIGTSEVSGTEDPVTKKTPGKIGRFQYTTGLWAMLAKKGDTWVTLEKNGPYSFFKAPTGTSISRITASLSGNSLPVTFAYARRKLS